MNVFNMSEKVVLITGANGLIGQTLVKAFTELGAKLSLLDNQPVKIGKGTEGNIQVLNFQADITDAESVKNVLTKTLEKFKKIDVLINLAAIDAKFDKNSGTGSKSAFENFPLDAWEKSLKVNMTGTFTMTQEVIKVMLSQGSGNIINVASTYSLVSPNQNLYKFEGQTEQLYKPIDYVATKSMIPNFTRYLATLYAKKGIRVNTIVPHGVVEDADPQFIQNFNKLSPLGRVCKKEELIGPFVFLASDASSYMTGSTLVVDGGWTAW
jgi:NAD(P)-dependent dehydrogenase (short-subunit alcohol dehydrogenase family)